jgi:hypothetical protein
MGHLKDTGACAGREAADVSAPPYRLPGGILAGAGQVRGIWRRGSEGWWRA